MTGYGRSIAGLALALVAGLSWAQPAIDADAALQLLKRNDCLKCHAVDKEKKGPAYRRIAGRLKSKSDAVEVIIEHVSSGPLIQFDDGTNDRHKIIDTRDRQELENLARWILSL